MSEVVNMTDVSLSPDKFKWADGSYPPEPHDVVKRIVLTQHISPKSRYCFPCKPIVDCNTLDEFTGTIVTNIELFAALMIHSKTTEIFIQTRQWIPGKWYDEWDMVQKDGRYSGWETTKVLKERTDARS